MHGGGLGFDTPAVETRGAESVSIRVTLTSGYTGPGTYTSHAQQALTGVATVAVGMAEGPSYYSFHSRDGVTTLTVAPDGSGTAEFSTWADDEVRGGIGTGDISGSMSWSCR